MTPEQFKTVKFFKPSEKWGDLSKIDQLLVYCLDRTRMQGNCPFSIHCAYESSGHSEDSYHYKGQAVDGHFVGMHLLNQLLVAERTNLWRGIGLYPFWNNPGLHLDVRGGQPLRWIRDQAGIYHYNPTFEVIINITKESRHPMCQIK
ncbi:MAG: hypothetical protein AB1403_21300 [Candidatus Riflebacteria bacterium]